MIVSADIIKGLGQKRIEPFNGLWVYYERKLYVSRDYGATHAEAFPKIPNDTIDFVLRGVVDVFGDTATIIFNPAMTGLNDIPVSVKNQIIDRFNLKGMPLEIEYDETAAMMDHQYYRDRYSIKDIKINGTNQTKKVRLLYQPTGDQSIIGIKGIKVLAGKEPRAGIWFYYDAKMYARTVDKAETMADLPTHAVWMDMLEIPNEEYDNIPRGFVRPSGGYTLEGKPIVQISSYSGKGNQHLSNIIYNKVVDAFDLKDAEVYEEEFYEKYAISDIKLLGREKRDYERAEWFYYNGKVYTKPLSLANYRPLHAQWMYDIGVPIAHFDNIPRGSIESRGNGKDYLFYYYNPTGGPLPNSVYDRVVRAFGLEGMKLQEISYMGEPEQVSYVKIADIKVLASKEIMYHGTSTVFLKEILSQGMNPNPKKKMWDEEGTDNKGRTRDKDFSGWSQTRSLESLQGTYFTGNAGTASLSAQNTSQKFGGNRLYIVAQIETRTQSVLPDEDDIASSVLDIFRGSWVGDPIGRWYVDRVVGLDTGYWEDRYQNMWDKFTKSLIYMYPYVSEQELDRGKNAFIDAIDIYNYMELAKYMDQLIEPDDAEGFGGGRRGTYSDPFYRAVMETAEASGMDGDELLRRFPAPDFDEAVASYKQAQDELTKQLKFMANPSKDEFNPTLRIVEPVTYRGVNRIIAIVEDDQSKYEDGISHIYRIHYGTVEDAKLFLNEYQRAKGGSYQLVDKQGNVVEEQKDKYAIKDIVRLGNKIKVFRGVDSKGWEGMRPSEEGVYGSGIYFYDNYEQAAAYSSRGGGVIVGELDSDDPDVLVEDNLVLVKSIESVNILGIIDETSLSKDEYHNEIKNLIGDDEFTRLEDIQYKRNRERWAVADIKLLASWYGVYTRSKNKWMPQNLTADQQLADRFASNAINHGADRAVVISFNGGEIGNNTGKAPDVNPMDYPLVADYKDTSDPMKRRLGIVDIKVLGESYESRAKRIKEQLLELPELKGAKVYEFNMDAGTHPHIQLDLTSKQVEVHLEIEKSGDVVLTGIKSKGGGAGTRIVNRLKELAGTDLKVFFPYNEEYWSTKHPELEEKVINI